MKNFNDAVKAVQKFNEIIDCVDGTSCSYVVWIEFFDLNYVIKILNEELYDSYDEDPNDDVFTIIVDRFIEIENNLNIVAKHVKKVTKG